MTTIPACVQPALCMFSDVDLYNDVVPFPTSCRWNVRLPSLLEIGITLTDDNRVEDVYRNGMVQSIVSETLLEGSVTSVLNNCHFTVALTSLEPADKDDQVSENLILRPILSSPPSVRLRYKCTLLSMTVVQHAIEWLLGTLPQEVPTDLKGAVDYYLGKLAEALPATASNEFLWAFITSHWQRTYLPRLLDENEHPEVVKCRLWRFIYDHLAQETKVIGHWIQGQTRLCAMTLAFTGHGGVNEIRSRGVITHLQYHVVLQLDR